MDLHYNGFCNSVLWQLFHYVPLNTESKLSETKTLQKQWEAYQAANNAFADAVMQVYQPGDVVWVQDYHLMLLPGILKTRVADMKVSSQSPLGCVCVGVAGEGCENLKAAVLHRIIQPPRHLHDKPYSHCADLERMP